ncbi:MAG: histidine phosphatase family protein [Marinibacterium sp.]|nr:histidine phosphatase family protein [Marinibacterium sp.]
MSLTLILMRHAKSSWSALDLADHDRALNARGTRSAQAMGDWLRAQGHVPDQILTSTARRTVDTCAGLQFQITPDEVPALYHAAPETMLSVLQGATGSTVLMLGHNPGIAEFAARLVHKAPDHARFHDYPTCATLVARFDRAKGWRDVGFGSGEAVDFQIPRNLTD